MQVRAIASATCTLVKQGKKPMPEIMIPLVSVVTELEMLRAESEEVIADVCAEQGIELDIKIGTMIELPRAAVTADEIAEVADFFSFGTNDLTQTTFGFSRDDIESKFLPKYLERKVLTRNPFETVDSGVATLVDMAVKARPRGEPRPAMRRVRRARRRSRVGARLLQDRARLRIVLAVPRAARSPRCGAGEARRDRGEV